MRKITTHLRESNSNHKISKSRLVSSQYLTTITYHTSADRLRHPSPDPLCCPDSSEKWRPIKLLAWRNHRLRHSGNALIYLRLHWEYERREEFSRHGERPGESRFQTRTAEFLSHHLCISDALPAWDSWNTWFRAKYSLGCFKHYTSSTVNARTYSDRPNALNVGRCDTAKKQILERLWVGKYD